ncbi:MAG: hypothetical protein MUD00_01740 [Candidatus Pacebacteria bacterium]|jgi:hypothetical protein|nr:hypothetical protein [Candidatus Paceibacterota bacterium]
MTISSFKIHTRIVNNDNLMERSFRALCLTLGLLFLAYLYFLGTITFGIVERRALEAQAKELASEVSTLELQYLALSNNIDIELAETLGFTETKSARFVSRVPDAPSFAIRDHVVQ